MIGKFRRNSEKFMTRRRSSVQSSDTTTRVKSNDETSNATVRRTSTNSSLVTFFSLPAEIRNAIYEAVARDMSLSVSPSMPSSGATQLLSRRYSTPTPPNLLLASQQVRREFRPILLSTSRINFLIRDFDFRNLVRVISSLYATELKALRSNPRLNVAFLFPSTKKPSPPMLASIRRWLDNRVQTLARVPFDYKVLWTTDAQVAAAAVSDGQKGKSRGAEVAIWKKRLVEVDVWLEALSQLHWNLQESLQWELQAVISAFEAERAVLRERIASSARSCDADGAGARVGYMMSI